MLDLDKLWQGGRRRAFQLDRVYLIGRKTAGTQDRINNGRLP